jgi:hypothetical protein
MSAHSFDLIDKAFTAGNLVLTERRWDFFSVWNFEKGLDKKES